MRRHAPICVPLLVSLLFAPVASCARPLPEVHAPAQAGRSVPAQVRESASSSTGAASLVEARLDEVEHRTFLWFWDHAHPTTRLIPDRAPTPSFSSIAAVGFGLTAYVVGAQRGWVTRGAARDRTRETLRFLLDLPQGPEGTGVAGYKGFFYHFLDMNTGLRFEKVELSTIDTSLLMAGVLASASYFNGSDPVETEIRDQAETLYGRVDWAWAQNRPPAITLGWTPEEGFIPYDWRGFSESMIVYVLALGSPTHPVGPEAWQAWTSTYKWARFEGQEYVQFAPLFGHQYSHVWIDFRGIKDAAMRRRGIDYFENSRRATRAHRAYATANPMRWKDYGRTIWGLTACDGPIDATYDVDGTARRFFSYAARGASIDDTRDDGTVAPTAAISSLPFVPKIALPALLDMQSRYGADLYGEYGFKDAFNPSFQFPVAVQLGHVVPGKGWFDDDQLGIDQGPIVAMIENYRSGLLWKLGRANPHLVLGLRRAGFAGGWLSTPRR